MGYNYVSTKSRGGINDHHLVVPKTSNKALFRGFNDAINATSSSVNIEKPMIDKCFRSNEFVFKSS